MSPKASGIGEYNSIITCLIEISNKELFWRPTIVINIDKETSDAKDIFVTEVVVKLIEEVVAFMTINPFENYTLNPIAANYLVVGYFEDCDTLAKINFEIIEENVMYLMILEHYVEDICQRNFKGIGHVVGGYDISFFVKNTENNNVYDLFTYKPEVVAKTCEVTVREPRKINTCKNGKLTATDVFPLKNPVNFNGCPIKVGMGPLFPFATIENKSYLQTNDHIDLNHVSGVDFELINIILEYFNASLDLRYIFKLEENAFLNMEFIELVHNGSLEICAGGLYRIYGDAVEYSGIYARQTVTWIYYAERLTKTWQNLITTVDGLYLFMIFYFSYSAVWYLIRIFDTDSVSLKDTLLYAWGVLVGTASLQDARTSKQKLLNSVYLIMCLHLSVYINIQLYSFLTIHEPAETFKTNDAVMKSGRVPYLHPSAKYFVSDDKYIAFANTSKDCDTFADCAIQSYIHKGITVVIEGFAFHFQVATAVNDEARILRPSENLLTVYYEMIIRKGHPLVKKFQRVMGRLFEAGIPEKLCKEAIGLIVVNKAKIAAQNLLTKSYSCQSGCTLNLQQFGGVLYIVIFGCIASSVLFVLEFVSIKAN